MVNSERVPLSEEQIDECVAKAEAWEAGKTARAWSELRSRRNAKLESTDWRAGSDHTLGDWAGYRKALRDFPSTFTDADVVKDDFFEKLEWPSEPS
jgi:hypothetical protein